MTLEEAVADIERIFVCDDGPPASEDAAGQPYTVVCSGGVKLEGEQTPALFSTPEQAISEWSRSVLRFAADFRTTTKVAAMKNPIVMLHWRTRPELDEITIVQAILPEEIIPAPTKWWCVWSRLSIEVANDGGRAAA